MDREKMERFFEAYLKEHKLKFSKKKGIYTVALDKTHERWYGTKKLACTFDPKIAKDRGVELLGVGTFMFDSMVTRFADNVVISHVKVPGSKEVLLEVNERLPELGKSAGYNISEKEGVGAYMVFELVITTANRKQTLTEPVLMVDGVMTKADGFEDNDFERVKGDIRIEDQVDKGLEFLQGSLKDTIGEAEKEHEKDMAELIRIQNEHAEQQYKELRKKEDLLINRMEDTRSKAVSASSFTKQREYYDKVKSLKKKHEELVKKNDKKRAEIKKAADEQIDLLKNRTLSVQARVLAFAKVHLQLFLVEYDDKSAYYYIPALKKFAALPKSS